MENIAHDFRRGRASHCKRWIFTFVAIARVRFFLFALISSLGLISNVFAQSVADIQRAWAERERAAPYVKIQWREVSVVHKGSQVGWQQGNASSVHANKDCLLIHRCELVLGDGANLRYVRKGPVWIAKRLKFEDATSIITYDGLTSRMRDFGPAYAEEGANGYVEGKLHGFADARLWPVIWGFRPLVTSISGLDFQQWQLGEVKQIGGSGCISLKRQITGGHTREIFLDTVRHFIPVRIVETVNSRLRMELTVTYDTDNDRERISIPRTWKCTSLDANGNA